MAGNTGWIVCWCLPVSALPNRMASPVISHGSTFHFSTVLFMQPAPGLGVRAPANPWGGWCPSGRQGVSLVKSAALRTVSLIPQQEQGSWSRPSVQPVQWYHLQWIWCMTSLPECNCVASRVSALFFSLASFCFGQPPQIISVLQKVFFFSPLHQISWKTM